MVDDSEKQQSTMDKERNSSDVHRLWALSDFFALLFLYLFFCYTKKINPTVMYRSFFFSSLLKAPITLPVSCVIDVRDDHTHSISPRL